VKTRIVRAAEALGVRFPRNMKAFVSRIAAVLVAVAGVTFNAGLASAATYTNSSVALSDPRPSQASVNYTWTGSSVTSGTIKCVKAVFATTSTGDTAPTNWSGASGSITAASSTLVNSSATNWSLATTDGTASTGQKNIWKYTNSAAGITPSTLTGATFIMAGITNSSVADTGYYLQFSTYNNTDCQSNPVDNATVQFINTNGSTLSLTIDNSLSFSVAGVSQGTNCAGTSTPAAQNSTGTTLPFGTVTASNNSFACQDLSAATNATNGYTIFARYTAKPTNALSQTIQDVQNSGSNSAPAAFTSTGTEGYGYTTNDQSLSTCGGSCNANRFYNGTTYAYSPLTSSNAEVAYEAAGVTSTTYRITHQVGVSLTTNPGTYTTTVIYTCTPVY
jgi:hypothetical protein